LPGTAQSIETKHRIYEMVVLGDGAALISGHPEFCPEPTEVHVAGSTWGGSMIKSNFLGDAPRTQAPAGHNVHVPHYRHPPLRELFALRVHTESVIERITLLQRPAGRCLACLRCGDSRN
jgi:hypothetical protein